MKKFLAIIISIAVCLIFTANLYAANNVLEVPEIKIYINDILKVQNGTPLSINNRTMLPLRSVINSLGVPNDSEHIIWNGSDKSVIINKNGTTIRLIQGEDTAYIDGVPITLDAAPFGYDKNERTYVPLRFIAQTFNYVVVWNGKTKSIFIHDTMDQKVMWVEMHTMANYNIISVDRMYYGEKQIEYDHVTELIAIVEQSSFDDKDKLLEILTRWKKGDFRQCVEDHNYIWEKLGGEVGRAVRLTDRVQQAMESYVEPTE